MGDIINFRRARKDKERRQREQTAAEHRRQFGRTKAEREKEVADRERALREIDAHKRETD